MANHLRPEGWNNWNDNAANEKTAWYAEIGSTGEGAGNRSRVSWAHPVTPAQALAFYPQTFLRGDDNWNPTAINF